MYAGFGDIYWIEREEPRNDVPGFSAFILCILYTILIDLDQEI